MNDLITIWWAPRDASWYSRPDTRSVKKLHRMLSDETAACKPGRLLLYAEGANADKDVPMSRMCVRCLRTRRK